MQTAEISGRIAQVKQAMEENGYSKRRLLQFNSTTNQLLKFMESCEIEEYNMDVGLRFISEWYGFKADGTLSHVNQSRLQDLNML